MARRMHRVHQRLSLGRTRAGLLAVSLGVISALTVDAGAQAAVRYAAAASTATGGGCASGAPCTLAGAITAAVPGDEVVVTSGAYDLTAPLTSANPVAIHGETGRPRPVITVAASLVKDGLHAGSGSSVSNLEFVLLAPTVDAVDLDGAVGEGLVVRDKGPAPASGTNHPPASVDLPASPGTVLRDSLVLVDAPGKVGVLMRSPRSASPADSATVANVTVVASDAAAGSTGVQSTMTQGTGRAVNVIARGTGNDVVASGSAPLSVTHSNFRPGLSTGYVDQGGNQDATPLFVDRAGDDLHETGGSATVDAGTSEPATGARDLDGAPRTSGPAPDMGAFEFVAPPAQQPPPVAEPPAPEPVEQSPAFGAPLAPSSPASPGPGSPATQPGSVPVLAAQSPHPTQGQTMVTAPVSGTVLVKPVGSSRFLTLAASQSVRLGSLVDSRRGKVAIITALDARGAAQSASFSSGMFSITQAKDQAVADIALRGGSFADCPRTMAPARTKGTAARAHRPRVVRRLWTSDDHGKYRTHGRNSTALVRGTRWLTEERCDGTLTRVAAGAVSVRERRSGRTVVLRAGQQHLARG